MVDISPASPAAIARSASDDGEGYDVESRSTGLPYEPGDGESSAMSTRIAAEFWADGPTSETPPGHWNSIWRTRSLSTPTSSADSSAKAKSSTSSSWDVHVYLVLNGALHDAAIAAWELKRYYESARPITLIRHLSEPRAALRSGRSVVQPRRHSPAVDGLVEVITSKRAAPRANDTQHLARYVGEIAVYSWRGEPGDRDNEVGGFDWIRGDRVVPVSTAYVRHTGVPRLRVRSQHVLPRSRRSPDRA